MRELLCSRSQSTDVTRFISAETSTPALERFGPTSRLLHSSRRSLSCPPLAEFLWRNSDSTLMIVCTFTSPRQKRNGTTP